MDTSRCGVPRLGKHVAQRFAPDSSLCYTNQRPTCSAIPMPGLRRTNRRASIVICISQ